MCGTNGVASYDAPHCISEHRVKVLQQRAAFLCCLLLPGEALATVVIAGAPEKADPRGPRVLLVLECVLSTGTIL